MKCRSIIIILLFSSFSVQAQQPNIELTESDLEAFKERVGVMIDDFQDYLSIIGSKERPRKVKTYYIGQTLELFTNKGAGVVMETSSTRTSRITRRPIKLYLTRLANLRYAKVEITQAETFYISNFYKVGDNKYRATATIFQKFCGYNKYGDRYVKRYCDITKKTIEIHIELVSDLYGDRWIVKLGNVSVAETTPSD